MEPESESQFIGFNESQENYSPLSKFPPLSIVDDYESQISLPPPTGTIIVDQNENKYFSPNYLQTKDAKDYPHEPCSYYPEHSVIAQNNASTNRTSSFSPTTFTNIISTTCLGFNSSTASNKCIVCNGETSKAHSCPGCFKFIHTICGRADTDEDEGFGSMVWCPNCDIKEQNKNREKDRLGIKRHQESP